MPQTALYSILNLYTKSLSRQELQKLLTAVRPRGIRLLHGQPSGCTQGFAIEAGR
jgi:hypothetical protein